MQFPKEKKTSPIDVDELRDAERAIIKLVQDQTFKEELLSLGSSRKEVKKSSSIAKLDPTPIEGILRVGGRLQKSPIDQEAKHPTILPKDHHVSDLIIRHYHLVSGHSRIEHTLSLIRQKYWIIKARVSLRRILSSCFDCHVGVDCFGPFNVRRGRGTAKRYGVLFTCLSIRAIHIEVVHSLDTDSFINALRRFIARRGQPLHMRSDNGGNFVTGEKELREAIHEWNQLKIQEFLLAKGIKWTFNPPAGSHHGGVWERCIRTVRKVMAALVKEQTLDDEGLLTLTCEVEAIVNG